MWKWLKKLRRTPSAQHMRTDDYAAPRVRDVQKLLEPVHPPEWGARSDPFHPEWKRWFEEQSHRESLMVDRNLLGQELERSGDLPTAIALYEANARDGFDGNFPYDRLAVIYRKQGKLDDEIRILRRAIEVFSAYRGPRTDIQPKLATFERRLERAEALKAKRNVGQGDANTS
jgi:tetratricopeptide (TPR) repeat protein